MYLPKAFEVTDLGVLHDFMEQYSFVTLLTSVQGAMFTTHLPLVLDRERGEKGTLIGHVARANPHWRSFDARTEALAIFQGPHSYISPSWYATTPVVPTWNYAAVHAWGSPCLIEDKAEVSALLDRMVAVYEATFDTPWSGELPVEFKQRLIGGIVGFELPIARIEGKFKLGQNRSPQDQWRVLRRLKSLPDQHAWALASLMRKLGIPDPQAK